MDITKLSLNDLKALAYDQLAQMELAQANLKAINEEIAKRSGQEDAKKYLEKENKKK